MNDLILQSNSIIEDNTYELTFFNGDFNINYSDTQNVNLILQYDKGHLLQYPKLGVGIDSMINSSNLTSQMKSKIIEELKNDNITPKEIYIDEDGEININI